MTTQDYTQGVKAAAAAVAEKTEQQQQVLHWFFEAFERMDWKTNCPLRTRKCLAIGPFIYYNRRWERRCSFQLWGLLLLVLVGDCHEIITARMASLTVSISMS
jgi:hypothetical protein